MKRKKIIYAFLSIILVIINLSGCSSSYDDGYKHGKKSRYANIIKNQKIYNSSVGIKKADAYAVLKFEYVDSCVDFTRMMKNLNEDFRDAKYVTEWKKGCYNGLFDK